jgi:hypothetical protein
VEAVLILIGIAALVVIATVIAISRPGSGGTTRRRGRADARNAWVSSITGSYGSDGGGSSYGGDCGGGSSGGGFGGGGGDGGGGGGGSC